MPTKPYPKLAATTWATLRSRASSSPTTKFTPEAVAALMGLSSPKSARDNITRPMRQLGLIDEEGALTKRGHKWRVDSSVGEACQEMLDEIYPDELMGLVDDSGNLSKQMVSAWFQQKGYGKSNANGMAVTYVTVASKGSPEPRGGTDRSVSKPRITKSTGNSREPTKESLAGRVGESPSPPAIATGGPTVHIDIQIHIPVDATPEQIDQIFSSMARHLYSP